MYSPIFINATTVASVIARMLRSEMVLHSTALAYREQVHRPGVDFDIGIPSHTPFEDRTGWFKAKFPTLELEELSTRDLVPESDELVFN